MGCEYLILLKKSLGGYDSPYLSSFNNYFTMKKLFFLLLVLMTTICQIVSAKTFSEVGGAPFSSIYASSIAFADIDGNKYHGVLKVCQYCQIV
jgi:hypothetical protein